MTRLLEPILIKSAASSPPYTVRVVFVVSLMQLATPQGGMSFDDKGVPMVRPKAMDNYMQSKAGGTWLTADFAKRLGKQGIMSVVSSGEYCTKIRANERSVYIQD